MWGSGTWGSVPAVVKPLLLRWGPRGFEARRLAGDADVVEDLADGVAILDDGDQLASPPALGTFENVCQKYPFKKAPRTSTSGVN